jgi:hypothetical protein
VAEGAAAREGDAERGVIQDRLIFQQRLAKLEFAVLCGTMRGDLGKDDAS